MTYAQIAISSGHGKYVRGASGVLDEVDEARKVVDALADLLEARGVDVNVYHDNTSTTQGENLDWIVNSHNSQDRELDISVHFNAYVETTKPMGTEVLYLTQQGLASDLSEAISDAGSFINRGAKKRTDLAFLNGTDAPAVLLEVCFVDSEADAELYLEQFSAIVHALADELAGSQDAVAPPKPEVEPVEFRVVGLCSSFGGPNDYGVSADEGLAFISEIEQMPQLFLPFQPEGTTGLARRLNPYVHYVACRWDYSETSKTALLEDVALVRSTRTGVALTAFPADWGPHEDTRRVADLSPGLLDDLGITTDEEVEVVFPYRRE